jgi:hypothetical protein
MKKRTNMFLGFALAYGVVACSSMTLAQEDIDSLHSIELATAKAYSYIDPDGGPSPSRAMDRMAYCNAEAILRRNRVADAGFDTKGMINCTPAGKQ